MAVLDGISSCKNLPRGPGDKDICNDFIPSVSREDQPQEVGGGGSRVASLGRSLANAWGFLDCLFVHSVQDLLEVWEQIESGRLREDQGGSQGRLLGTDVGFTPGRNG